jgi:hypothetical protein
VGNGLAAVEKNRRINAPHDIGKIIIITKLLILPLFRFKFLLSD